MGQEHERAAPARGSRAVPASMRRSLRWRRRTHSSCTACPRTRGEESPPTCSTAQRSAIWDEAENRLHAQKACSRLLLAATRLQPVQSTVRSRQRLQPAATGAERFPSSHARPTTTPSRPSVAHRVDVRGVADPSGGEDAPANAAAPRASGRDRGRRACRRGRSPCRRRSRRLRRAARERLLRRQPRSTRASPPCARFRRDVDGDGDAIAESRDEFAASGVGAERGGADDDSRDARAGQRVRVRDANGRRRRAAPLPEPPPRRRRGELERRPPVPRRAERDDVDERRPRPRRAAHELERIAGVDLDPVVVAPQEPHGLSRRGRPLPEALQIAYHCATW